MLTEFAKYEGAGNDFILIDNREGLFTPDPALIARLCDRHFGIGADGLMTLARNAEIDCSMRYYNADGSEGEMCGNGARCFTLFAEHLGIGGETKFFDAADGLHTARIHRTKGFSGEIELGMIAVREIRAGDNWWFLNTGVPHYVEFVDDLKVVDVVSRGAPSATIRPDSRRARTSISSRLPVRAPSASAPTNAASRTKRSPAEPESRQPPSSPTSPCNTTRTTTASRSAAVNSRSVSPTKHTRKPIWTSV